MACTFQVGRVGLDLDLNSPQTWDDQVADDWHTTIEVILRGASLADTLVLRSELLAQVGQLVPVLYSPDPTAAGFYRLAEAAVSKQYSDAALQEPGFLRGSVTLKRDGTFSSAELQSMLSRVSAAEDFSTTPSFNWAPAIGAKAVDATPAFPTLIERAGEDGTITVGIDIDEDCNPSWSVDPANYYQGGCQIWAGDRLRTGKEMPMNVTDWYLSNSLMQLRPGIYQGVSDGTLELRWHDGTSWGDWVPFQFNWAGTNTIPSFDFVTILISEADTVSIRLTRDAEEAPTSTWAIHELDITMRRGGRSVSMVYKFTGAAETHALEQADGIASTRPGGNASYVVSDSLISGDRIVWGMPRDFTHSGAEIELDAASQSMPCWIGAAVDDAADGTGNGPADLAAQYVGQVAETVRAVTR